MKSLVFLSVPGDNYRKIKSGTEMRPYDHSVEDLMKILLYLVHLTVTKLNRTNCKGTQISITEAH